jgi:hypothetical protein
MIVSPLRLRFNGAWPPLTRRRYPERQDCWHIYYGDVHVGTIAIRNGIPPDEDPWEWSVGFYPGSHPGEHSNGTAETVEQARIDFETAWNDLLPTLTEADFDRWRDQRDWTERKYAMWARGERMPSQKPNSMMRCPCGETFDSHRLEHTLIHVPRISAVARVAR